MIPVIFASRTDLTGESSCRWHREPVDPDGNMQTERVHAGKREWSGENDRGGEYRDRND